MIAEEAQGVQTERLAQQAASGVQDFQRLTAQAQVRSDVIIIQKDEVEKSRRAILDFQTGTNTTLTLTDDPVGQRTLIKYSTTASVSSLSAGTGITLTPNPITTTGTIALTVPVAEVNGGTNQTTYTTGDILYASAANTLSKLADAATGNALISGGAGVAPSYGKIGLTTHVSGTLGVTNGGTGTATQFTQGSVVFAGPSGVYAQDNTNFSFDDTANVLTILKVKTANQFVPSDSTTAWQFFKADGTTQIAKIDSTNGRFLVGSTGTAGYLLTVSATSGTFAGFGDQDGTGALFLIAKSGTSDVLLNSRNNQALILAANNTIGLTIGTDIGVTIPGYISNTAPVTKSADFTWATTENWIINNKAGSTCVATLPTASSFTGRILHIKNIQTQLVNSASSNVVPLIGGAAGTAILAATAGKWATMVSDGTNWVIVEGN